MTATPAPSQPRPAAATAGPARPRAGRPARHLSPGATRNGGVGGMLGAQVAAELRGNLRLPEFMAGVVAVPVILYTMFGLPQAGQVLPGGTDVGGLLAMSMSAYGVVSLAIFTFGVDIAQERGSGWLRRLRATPLPVWVYLAAKCTMALAFSVVIVGAVLALAVLAGGVAFDVPRLARAALVLLSGAVAFSTLGFAIAFWARPRAATAIGNLVFLPLSFASGFFFPLDQLPGFVQDVAPYLPTYHFGQLVWNALAPEGDVTAFGAPAPGAPGVHLAWVAGSFVVFALIAAAGYRRDRDRTA